MRACDKFIMHSKEELKVQARELKTEKKQWTLNKCFKKVAWKRWKALSSKAKLKYSEEARASETRRKRDANGQFVQGDEPVGISDDASIMALVASPSPGKKKIALEMDTPVKASFFFFCFFFPY